MSFFKKLTEEFKELKANFDDSGKEKKDEKKDSEVKPEKTAEGTREGGSGPPPYAGGDSYGQHQQQYGAPPSQYQQAPPSHYPQAPPSQYSQPPYGQQYAATPPPPPSGAAPPGQPQLPPGWISQWDHTQQRYYYVEQATGRTQWDPPQNHNYSSPPLQHGGYAPPPTGPGGYHEQSRDQGAASGFYNQYGGAMPAQGYNNPQHQDNAQQYYGDVAKTEKKEEKKAEKKKEDHSTRNMLLAGAGGLAVGGLAVAALDSDSDDEHKSHAPAPAAPAPSFDPGYGSSNAGYGAPAAAGYGAGGYGADPSYGGYPPAAPPPGDESDRESLVEARQDYNEAVEAAADSDASSSELEELQEAREDYEEAAEDYYED